jgi:predicted N-acyltransferase
VSDGSQKRDHWVSKTNEPTDNNSHLEAHVMDYRIARSIHEFDETLWDTVAGKDAMMTHRWQRIMEACYLRYEPRYLLLQDDRGLLAAVIVTVNHNFGRTGWRESLLRRITMTVRPPFLAARCGIALRPDTTLAEAVPHLERALRRLLRQEKRLILAINNVATSDLPAWRAHHFFLQRQARVADLALPSTYDQYLAALPKKSRAELRRMRRRSETCAVTFEHGPLAGDGEQLYPLIYAVFNRHGLAGDKFPLDVTAFAVLEREMPGKVIVFKGFVAGELAGVCVCINDENTLWWWLAGLDYELARPSYVYFLLIDEMIRWGIEQGLQCINGGLANEREKQKQGFTLRPIWICYRFGSPALNAILGVVQPLAQRLIGRNAVTERLVGDPDSEIWQNRHEHDQPLSTPSRPPE